MTPKDSEPKTPERIWLHQQPTLGGLIVTPEGYFKRGSKDLEGATEYIRADLVSLPAEVEASDARLVKEIYNALNIRWRDVVLGDRFEDANRNFNRTLTDILSTFKNICTSHGVKLP